MSTGDISYELKVYSEQPREYAEIGCAALEASDLQLLREMLLTYVKDKEGPTAERAAILAATFKDMLSEMPGRCTD